MSSDLLQGFQLGPWKVEPLRGAVTGPHGETQHLEPKVMDVFVLLATQANELVIRDQLLDTIWSGNIARDELLTGAISDLRRALHDDPNDPDYIETVPKRGYRLIGQIHLPDGTRLEKNRSRSVVFTKLNEHKLASVIVTAVTLGLIYLAYDEFVIDPAQEEATATTSTQAENTSDANRWGKSIAVLPFVNMSDDPGNEYFSDGLSEEILTLLTRIPGLKVIGRTSSFSFKGKNEDLRVIGQTLGVKTILEGSVRKSGDRVRITAQLVDVSDGTHIWSNIYDRAVTDIFAVQDDVAAAIIDALQIHVGTNPNRGRPTENSEAYALFLKARSSISAFDYQNTEELLLMAIEIDPKFAEAYELLAANYFHQAGGSINAAEGQKLVGEAAAKALAIDPDLIFARTLYQIGNIENWSYAREIEALERAAREQPSNPELLYQLAWDLSVAGYLQEALGIAKRHADLDPLLQTANIRLAEALYAVGSTSEATALLELQVKLGNGYAARLLGEFNLIAMRDDTALEYFDASEQQFYFWDTDSVREFVPRARDPVTGQEYLDYRIPKIVASVPEEVTYELRFNLPAWYLFFGYLDRYLELILATDLTASTWADADGLFRLGTLYRRHGFTAHPKYLEVAEATGIVDVWEKRGPPDFCEKVDGQWVCE